MKNSLLSAIVLSAPLLLLSINSNAQGSTQALNTACETRYSDQQTITGIGLDNCMSYINGYLNGVIEAKKTALLESKFDNNLNTDSAPSSFQQRALETRIGSHIKRLNHEPIEQACALDTETRMSHIENIVDYLEYTGDQRVTLIKSINEMLDRGNIC